MICTRRHALSMFSAAAAVLAAPLRANALDTAAAREHVAIFARRLIEIVSGDDDIAAKQAAFKALLTEGAAVRQIARTAIGRPWRGMSPEQRERYQAAFVGYMTATYSKRFDDFRGDTISIGRAGDVDESGVIVDSLLVSGGGAKPIEVQWRVVEIKGAPKIFDVYVEGVSLLVTQRSEFSSILQRNGDDVEALIKQISS
ncbi:MAG: ABC transporter substrate-binding protein [Neomegalonema sp.]|nr:ABC transporter substrate-binding protein [Neomegalonema sp.]